VLYAVGGLSLLTWIAVTFWLATQLGFDQLAVALMASGVGYAVLSLWRPAWYWDSLGIWSLRKQLGDRGVLVISLLLCGFLSATGIHRQGRVQQARTQCATLLAATRSGAPRAAVYDHRVQLGPTEWLRGRKQVVSCKDILSREPF